MFFFPSVVSIEFFGINSEEKSYRWKCCNPWIPWRIKSRQDRQPTATRIKYICIITTFCNTIIHIRSSNSRGNNNYNWAPSLGQAMAIKRKTREWDIYLSNNNINWKWYWAQVIRPWFKIYTLDAFSIKNPISSFFFFPICSFFFFTILLFSKSSIWILSYLQRLKCYISEVRSDSIIYTFIIQ